MDTSQTTGTFIDFFTERAHRMIEPSPLVPPPGEPVLFTTAGMQPLTPYLLGRPHPLGRRLTGVQPCLRTTDLDEVGDPIHLTMFQMLGSWSLGDYDGPQSLRWGYELLTQGFGIGPERLHATVFGGDGELGPDLPSLEAWRDLGVPAEPTADGNWWSNGDTGPCGPDSEIFVWTGGGPPQGTPSTDGRWMELWNHVTMRYHRRPDGGLDPLPRPSVDTGMGLERLEMIRQGRSSVFGTSVFEPWLTALREMWDPGERPLRVLCDHLRTCVVIIGEGVRPSSGGRGYVLRRLLRRVLTTLWRVDDSRTLRGLPPGLIGGTLSQFGVHPEPGVIQDVLEGEERQFRGLLVRGRKILAGYTQPLSPEDLRYLHQTHGLPPDLVAELLGEAGHRPPR
jgi:alanyl-tRNA synthetase